MKMTNDPSSESEVLRATAILLLRILDVQPSPWTEESPGLLAREVGLRLEIEEILRGEVIQAAREPFDLAVVQRQPVGTRITDYYGLWSHVALEPGAELLAFCRGTSDDAGEQLTEDNCEQLLEHPQGPLADTRAALELEARGTSPQEILAAAEATAGEHGPIFARYVLAKSKPAALSAEPSSAHLGVLGMAAPQTEDTFEDLMRRLEDPRTTPLARESYLRSTYQELGLMAVPPPERVARLIEALRRLLLLPEAASMHSNIQEVYLPNLLAMAHGEP
jgi:hypothetical protein